MQCWVEKVCAPSGKSHGEGWSKSVQRQHGKLPVFRWEYTRRCLCKVTPACILPSPEPHQALATQNQNIALEESDITLVPGTHSPQPVASRASEGGGKLQWI